MHMGPSDYIKRAWELMKGDFGVLWGGIFLLNVLNAIVGSVIPVLGSLVFYGVVMSGIMIVCLKALRNQPYEFNDLFKGFDYFGEAFIAGILASLATTIAWFLCCLPGLFLTPFFFYPFAFIVDKKMKAMDALKASWDLVAKDYGRHLTLFLLTILINTAGLLLCCVGLIFTSVLTTIALAVAYYDLVPSEEVPVIAEVIEVVPPQDTI